MMFDHADLQLKLGRLFSAGTDRFDELLAAAGVNPKTDLVGADLQGANFTGSVMNGWDLSYCDLTGASFAGARIKNLIIRDAVGVDLSGAIPLDDSDERLAREPDSFDRTIEQIRSSTNGAQRGPLIKKLLDRHGFDDRTWPFLLNEQLKRERVGRLVSLIIDEWESRQSNPFAVGNELRIGLLQRN